MLQKKACSKFRKHPSISVSKKKLLPSKTSFVESLLTTVPDFPESFSKAVKSSSSVENLLTPVSVKNNPTDVILGIFRNFQNIQDRNLQLLNLQFTNMELHYRVFLKHFKFLVRFQQRWNLHALLLQWLKGNFSKCLYLLFEHNNLCYRTVDIHSITRIALRRLEKSFWKFLESLKIAIFVKLP